ncbi:MAG: DUF1285 domain-containing protein [Gammaproteobacteria bacterium]|nr:DUF1285 domain-containing protein [Gammaproteobacteria bacterium]
MTDLQSLVAAAEQLPDYAIDTWWPQQQGSIDICIRADGSWWHEGGLIKRHKLVQLFSRLLSYRNGHYCLLTPVEQLTIKVETLPFVIVQAVQQADAVWQLTTNIGEQIWLTEQHQLKVNMSVPGDIPTVLVRDQLWASLSRQAYYDMALKVDSIERGGRVIAQLQSAACVYDFGILE